MRVVALRRQRFGGVATLTSLLVEALDRVGVELVVDDADDWIPNETGGKIDRETSKRVRAAAQGFDLVHAFGYRAAWACSAAFGNQRWVYTAHDMPKSVHPQLIERLNDARAGACSSQAVHMQLEAAGARRLEVVRPGLPTGRRVLDKKEARAMLGVFEDAFLLVVSGRFCKEHSIDTAIHVTTALPHFARLYITGQGELESHLRQIANERTVVTSEPFSQQTAIAAADMVIVPSTVAGHSYTAIEAMLQGTPVALRRTGGLAELADDHRTAFYFETDEELLDLLNHLCFKRELVQEVGRAGRHHCLASFDIARTAESLKAIYTQALNLK